MVEPIISDLAQRTRFSILNKNDEDRIPLIRAVGYFSPGTLSPEPLNLVPIY
jgi:hypothetical protein